MSDLTICIRGSELSGLHLSPGQKYCALMLGCQDAYHRKSTAVLLLTQHNYHYRLTLQLYTTGFKMLLLNTVHIVYIDHYTEGSKGFIRDA